METFTLLIPSRIGEIDARITLDRPEYAMPGAQGIPAYGIAFNSEAETIAETDSTRYIDYCTWEIVYYEAHRLLNGRWGVEAEDIAAAVEDILPICDCD